MNTGIVVSEYLFTSSNFSFNWNNRGQITDELLLDRGEVSAFNVTENRYVNYRLRVDQDGLEHIHNYGVVDGTYPIIVTLIPATEYYPSEPLSFAAATVMTRTVYVTLYDSIGEDNDNENGSNGDDEDGTSGNNNNNNDGNRKTPNTGDTTSIIFMLTLVILTSGVAGVLVLKKQQN